MDIHKWHTHVHTYTYRDSSVVLSMIFIISYLHDPSQKTDRVRSRPQIIGNAVRRYTEVAIAQVQGGKRVRKHAGNWWYLAHAVHACGFPFALP